MSIYENAHQIAEARVVRPPIESPSSTLRIVRLAYPTVSTDAASKQYVDDQIAIIEPPPYPPDPRHWLDSVKAANTTDQAFAIQAFGDGMIFAQGPPFPIDHLEIDGITINYGERFLWTAETDTVNHKMMFNGVWEFRGPNPLNPGYWEAQRIHPLAYLDCVYVISGTVNGNKSFQMVTSTYVDPGIFTPSDALESTYQKLFNAWQIISSVPTSDIPSRILNKGAIVVTQDGGVLTYLPQGTAGQMLTVNPASPYGVSWV